MESFGEALKRLRGTKSLRELARAAYIDSGHLSRIERGQRHPTAEVAAALDAALAAEGYLLACATSSLRAVSTSRPVPPVGANERSDSDLAELMAWISGSNTTDSAIDQLERAVAYLATVHSKVSPNQVLSGVLQTRSQVETLLRSGRQRLRQTRELLRIDSALLSHACLLLGDIGDNQTAAQYGIAALMLAQEAGIDEAAAWTVRAKTARWQENFVESAELARRGFELAAVSPTKVELAYREANAIALFGDVSRAQLALRSAQTAAEQSSRDAPVDGADGTVWSFPVARQAIFTLSIAIHTGDPDGALKAAAMAEAAWANGEPKVPATWAQIQAGVCIASLMKESLDEAIHNIAPVLALPHELRVSTVVGYLRRLEAMLTRSRFRDDPPAVELAHQISDFVSASSPGKDEGR